MTSYAENKNKRVLIIGFGHAGKLYFNSLPNYFDVDVYDPNPIGYRGLKLNLINQIPRKGKYDYCFIASPTHEHVDHTRRALEISEKVLVEKPPAITVDDLRAMLMLARNTGRLYFAVHASFGEEIQKSQSINIEPINVSKFSQFFSDPYREQDKSNTLNTPFWDSIFNAIAIFQTIFGNKYKISSVQIDRNTKDEFLCYLKREKNRQVLDHTIHFSWITDLNYKVSQATMLNGSSYLFSHSQASVAELSGIKRDSYPFTSGRLQDHYRKCSDEFITLNDFKNNRRFIGQLIEDIEVIKISE